MSTGANKLSQMSPDVAIPSPDDSPSFAPSRPHVTAREAAGRSLREFLLTLFQLLDECSVRYCVLHSWEKLPDELPNDLDLAVLKEDKLKLRYVFDGLRSN